MAILQYTIEEVNTQRAEINLAHNWIEQNFEAPIDHVICNHPEKDREVWFRVDLSAWGIGYDEPITHRYTMMMFGIRVYRLYVYRNNDMVFVDWEP